MTACWEDTRLAARNRDRNTFGTRAPDPVCKFRLVEV